MKNHLYFQVKNILRKLWAEWQNFWFAPIDLYNVSLFRLLFGLSLVGLYFSRFSAFDFYFTESGILPIGEVSKVVSEGYASIFPFYLKTDAGIRAQGILHLCLIVLFTLGVFGRSLTWFLTVVNLGLMQRNMTVVYGADLFANFWLFYLSFVNHNQYFSIWNLLNKKRRIHERSDMFSTMGIRLLQIQLCMSYAYTGFEKLKGMQWWEGSAVWHVIGMDELMPHDFVFMQNFPLTIAAMSMATVIFEVYFIFAVWNQRLRYPWLVIGTVFHFSTALFMELWYFAFIMVAPYVLFLPPLKRHMRMKS